VSLDINISTMSSNKGNCTQPNNLQRQVDEYWPLLYRYIIYYRVPWRDDYIIPNATSWRKCRPVSGSWWFASRCRDQCGHGWRYWLPSPGPCRRLSNSPRRRSSNCGKSSQSTLWVGGEIPFTRKLISL
jgi:hypothetical protein